MAVGSASASPSAASRSPSSSNSNSSSSSSKSSSTQNNYKPAADTKTAAETARNSLQRGQEGQSVADMQRELNQSGANLEVDGKFGPKTEAAVKSYQTQKGLAVDGKAGMQTLGSLYNDQRGSDAYDGKTTGSTKAAPTSSDLAKQPAGTTKAAAVQRPMNPTGVRQKPPAANAPGSKTPPAAQSTPEKDQHVIDQAAAAQKASEGVRPKSAGLQDRPNANANVDKAGAADAASKVTAKDGQPPNKTATFDKISKTGQRNQMATGRVTVNGNTYDFRSGGHGRGNLPAGDYKVTPHMYSRGDASMSVSDAKGKVGYSYALSDKYDSRVGGTRSLLRIHPDGRSPGTMGCMGIVGNAETQRQFRADMQAELARNGGSFTLRVG